MAYLISTHIPLTTACHMTMAKVNGTRTYVSHAGKILRNLCQRASMENPLVHGRQKFGTIVEFTTLRENMYI